MLIHLLVGLVVMVLCLLTQAVFVILSLRYYVNRVQNRKDRGTSAWGFTLMSVVMLILAVGNFVQIGIWAALFLSLGEFANFETAAYYSGVTFTSLGYGDVVMSDRWRMLGPIEAANGILMLGVSTALMTASVSEMLRSARARLQEKEGR
jgi:voltage-gated potassium channel Kch